MAWIRNRMSEIFHDLILSSLEISSFFWRLLLLFIIWGCEIESKSKSASEFISIHFRQFRQFEINLLQLQTLFYFIDGVLPHYLLRIFTLEIRNPNSQIVTFFKVPYFYCHVYFCLLSSQLIQLQRKLVIFLKHGKKFLEAFIVSVPTKRIQKILKKKRSRHVLKFQAWPPISRPDFWMW